MLQTPIIIDRKSQVAHAKSVSAKHYISDRKTSLKKTVEPFVPIQVPTRDRNKLRMDTSPPDSSGHRDKEIEIIIDEDNGDK